jgi:hypothetical protein
LAKKAGSDFKKDKCELNEEYYLMKTARLNLAFAIALIIIIISLALTYSGEYRWIGHAVVSILGLITLGVLVTTGMRLAGRLGTSVPGLFRQHRKISIFFTILMAGTSLYGLWVVLGAPVPKHLSSPHAWLGIAIIAIALAQLTPSLTMKRTAPLRYYHRIIGYLLASLVLIQVIIGVLMVLTE